MKNKLRVKIEIASGISIGLAGILIGNHYVNPSGFQSMTLSTLGGAVAGFSVASVLRVLNDREGVLKLDIKRLETELKIAQRKSNEEYEQSAEILAINQQLEDEKLQKIYEANALSLRIHDLEAWQSKAVKGIHNQNSEISRLRDEVKAVQTELSEALQENQEEFDSAVLAAVREQNAKLNTRAIAKIQRLEAGLRAEYELKHSQFSSEMEKLRAELEAAQTELDQVQAEKRELLQHCQDMNDKALPSIREAYEFDWQQNDSNIQTAIEQLQLANSQLASKLQNPRMFPGSTQIDSIGNRIIQHFFSYGVVMDAMEAIANSKGFKLRFKVDRTDSYQKITEEEFDKRGSEAGLIGLSEEPLDFDLDLRNFIVNVQIVTGSKTAKAKASKATEQVEAEISEYAAKFSFLKSATEFNKLAKILLFDNKVPSLRINGGSGSGKSSIARLLLAEGLKEKPFKIRLHDPQDGSSEDRWQMAKSSKNVKEAAESIFDLRDSVESKSNPITPVFDVFDEIDGMCRNNNDVKLAYLTISTQVRHLSNQNLIVIGQSPSVSRNGLQWADMDSVGCIYIADSAIQAIEHSPKLKGKNKKLADEYNQLLEASAESEEIDPIDFFRFALVVLPSKPAFWIELPKFSVGIAGYKGSTDGQTTRTENAESFTDKVVQAVHERDNEQTTDRQRTTTILKCPNCGSENIGSKGTQYHRCKDCSKSWKK